MKQNTCCFTGHRKLPSGKIKHMIKRLDDALERLIRQGVTDFISGGALGFDQIAASLVIAKKEMGASVRLVFALPCRNQDENWKEKEKRLYRSLLREADEIRYVSEEYSAGCMKKRNRYMVDHSSYCICALTRGASGTAQTVNYARRQGIQIINVMEYSSLDF